MRDPDEGIAPDGTIVTGVRRDRVPTAFAPVVDAAMAAVHAADPRTVLYLYGSVATGQARVGRSDVDLIAFAPDHPSTPAIAAELTAAFADVCREVGVGPMVPADLDGPGDQEYGNRVFLRHYCVRLSGPPEVDPVGDTAPYPADARAARGFDGDIGRNAARWATALGDGADPQAVAYRMGRKTLLAAASLVSVLDRTWTTDRTLGARRWAVHHPSAAPDLALLRTWAEPGGSRGVGRSEVERVLAGTVAALVTAFAAEVGLWRS